MYKETTDNTPIFRYIQRMADGVTSVLVRTVFGAVLGIEKIFNCHSQFKSTMILFSSMSTNKFTHLLRNENICFQQHC